jgi:hypothetical protein
MSQISEAAIRFQSANDRFKQQVENCKSSWNDEVARQFESITVGVLSNPAALVTKQMQMLETVINQARRNVN